MGYLLMMMPATESCRGTRHVFSSLILPPADDALCECGAVTWEQACAMRLHEVIASEHAAPEQSEETPNTKGGDE